MVEPARSKSIPRKTRSSRGCKATHSSNPRQGTAPREGGAVACGLVCLSTCRLRASLHEPGWPDWPVTGPIWVHMWNFSPVSDMRKGQRSWGRVLAPSSRNKANMVKHKKLQLSRLSVWQCVWLSLNGQVFTIYTNHPGGNLAYKHKTIKWDVVEERPSTKYFQISWTD